jgi:hypothetical protein
MYIVYFHHILAFALIMGLFFIYRKRLLALAAQKFITDIATDAFQFCKIRQQGNRSKQGKVCWQFESKNNE